MLKYCAFILLLSALTSCDSNDSVSKHAYFGGEIINPMDNFIVLHKDDKIIDTIPLDKNNKFLTKIKSCQSGLYYFYHKPEYQYVYIEPKDSLLLRLNTLEFDESLVFSGNGARRNNYLMNVYLEHEKDADKLFSAYQNDHYFKLGPDAFKKKVDSLKAAKHHILDVQNSKYNFSQDFLKLARASINLELNKYMELYLMHNTNKTISDDFYAYRNEVPLNDDALSIYLPYHNYLFNFANNVALSSFSERKTFVKETMSSPSFNHHTLKTLDSLIQHESLKNFLTKRAALKFLERTTCKNKAREYFNTFAKINTNTNHIKEIKEITKSITNLEVGNQIPNIDIKSNTNTSTLSQLLKKPTVFYFWTSNYARHLKSVHEKVAILKRNHVDIDFIGLNIDEGSKTWNDIINSYQYDDAMEYQFTDVKRAKQLLMLNSYNKIIIVDNSGKILSTKENIYSANFETQLVSLFAQ
jgi:hypothetical protein